MKRGDCFFFFYGFLGGRNRLEASLYLIDFFFSFLGMEIFRGLTFEGKMGGFFSLFDFVFMRTTACMCLP